MIERDHDKFFMRIVEFPGMEAITDTYWLWTYGDPRPFVLHSIKFWRHELKKWYNHGTSELEAPAEWSES